MSPNRGSRGSIAAWIKDHPVVAGLWIAVVLGFLSEMPWIGRSIRVHLLQGLIVGFFVLISFFGQSRENISQALRRGPNVWVLPLLLWCILDVLFPPTASLGFGGLMRPFAVAEMLRLVYCAGIFFVVAYCLKEEELLPLITGVLVLGGGVAFYALYQFGSQDSVNTMIASVFGNHEQAGSVLMILLPIAVALSFGRESGGRVPVAMMVIGVLLATGLLLVRTRSAWIGACAGLLTLAVLSLRTMTVRLDRRNGVLLLTPVLILAVGVIALLLNEDLSSHLLHRFGTFGHLADDSPFADRLNRWRSACRMAFEKPVTGWGLGAFPILQRRWTGTGDSPDWALTHGTGHSNLAHNFWVQWAAETGAVGLTLYVAVIVTFLLCAGLLLRQVAPGLRRQLLIGSIAATVGACADMIGAPSYTYPGESSLAWLIMGLGIAACRTKSRERGAEAAALPKTPVGIWAASVGVGVAASFLVLEVGAHTKPHSPTRNAAVSAPARPNPAKS